MIDPGTYHASKYEDQRYDRESDLINARLIGMANRLVQERTYVIDFLYPRN